MPRLPADSVVFLTDEGDEPARVGFQVQANGVHYYIGELELDPHETRAIDMRKLRDAGLPDFRKNVIPPGATDGSVSWIRIDNVAVSGRLMVLQRHKGMASSYDCYTGSCPATLSDGPYINPGDASIATGGTQGYTCTATYVDQNTVYYYGVFVNNVAWSSDNTAVASVSTSTATGVAGGTANVLGQTTSLCLQWGGDGIPKCPCTSSTTFNGSTPLNVTPKITSISPSKGLIGATTSGVNISGAGFGPNPTVSAGSGITVSGLTVNSAGTQITASFAVASGGPSGNNAVTVKAGGQTSNSVNFYVQVPTSLQVNFNQCTSVCSGGGNERGLAYTVMDQESAPAPIQVSGMSIVEQISNITLGCGNNLTDSGTWTTGANGQMLNPPSDGIYACGFGYPPCSNIFDQNFLVNGRSVKILSQDGTTLGSHNHITITCSYGVCSCPVVTITQ